MKKATESLFQDAAQLWAKPPETRTAKFWYAIDYFIEEKFVGSRAAWILSRPLAALGWFLASGSGPYE